jgi:hypothetical protein
MIIDVNAAVGRWPFCSAQSMTPSRLSTLLAKAGVDVALCSSLEACFHEDADEDNRRLSGQLRGHRRLRPVPVVNPSMANWPELVERWGPKAPAVKILPSYHAYALADARVDALAAELTRRRRPLLVQVRMEDERVQAPAFRVPPVPVADIAALAGRFPRLTIVALGTYLPEATCLLRQSPGVRIDISLLDRLDVVGELVRQHRLASRRLLLGTNSPLLHARAAVLKVQTARASRAARQAILGGNARRLLGL